MKKAKHGENNFVCIQFFQFDTNKPQKLEGLRHAFDLQTAYKVWVKSGPFLSVFSVCQNSLSQPQCSLDRSKPIRTSI